MIIVTPSAAAFVPRMVAECDDLVMNSLAFVRTHLAMDVAYVLEFVGNEIVFCAVSAPGFEGSFAFGGTRPLKSGYCHHIVAGRLPELIPDTAYEQLAQTTPVNHELPIRSYVSVPIRRTDGTVYGMFCSLGKAARPSLNSHDLEVVCAFASLDADQVNAQLGFDAAVQLKKSAIEDILKSWSFKIALQPILRRQDQGTAGYEALCRFSPEPYRAPNLWFDDAAEVGLQTELEIYVIEVALAFLLELPASCYLAVNTSPATLATGKLSKIIAAAGGGRVVVEITDYAAIENIDVFLMEIDHLLDLGARIAVDDADARYSVLQQIIRLRPDVIKLDMSLTQDVDKDLARRALASAMVQFAQDTKARVVAEGIETEAELRTLKI